MKLTYEIFASQTSEPTTAFRELTIQVNGIESKKEKYHYPIDFFGEYTFQIEDEVFLSLVELDGKNNENLMTILEFVADKNSSLEKNESLNAKLIKSETTESFPNYKDQNVYKKDLETWKMRDDI